MHISIDLTVMVTFDLTFSWIMLLEFETLFKFMDLSLLYLVIKHIGRACEL